jgi:DNA-binding SARP family transcriptional activator
VRISLLGPLQVDGELGTVRIGAAKERSLLSTLALTPGCIVSTDALINALWGDEPPSSARKTLQTYVWNLRQAFGSDIIVTDPAGYALCVEPDDVDVGRFRSLVRRAEDMLRGRDVGQARALLTEAVALWRDEPFPGVAPHSGLANQAVRLKEEYLSALEARIAADLAAGWSGAA